MDPGHRVNILHPMNTYLKMLTYIYLVQSQFQSLSFDYSECWVELNPKHHLSILFCPKCWVDC